MRRNRVRSVNRTGEYTPVLLPLGRPIGRGLVVVCGCGNSPRAPKGRFRKLLEVARRGSHVVLPQGHLLSCGAPVERFSARLQVTAYPTDWLKLKPLLDPL